MVASEHTKGMLSSVYYREIILNSEAFVRSGRNFLPWSWADAFSVSAKPPRR